MSDFWARRKASVEAEDKVAQAVDAQVELAAQDADLDSLSDAEILEQLDLPDPETLGVEDDFKVFWSKAVPSRIRTRAMRRLWQVNPILANVDGLVGYGEDFTDAALIIEGMETSYQVGKGMTAHVEELARQAEEEANRTEPVEEDIRDAEDVPVEVPTEVAEPVALTAAQPEPTPAPFPEFESEDEPQPAPVGRMRFHFGETAQA